MQIHVCSPGLIPEDKVGVSLKTNWSVPRVGSWHRSTGMRQTMSIPINSYLPKLGELTEFVSGVLIPELWPRIMWRCVSWPQPAISQCWSEDLISEYWSTRIPSETVHCTFCCTSWERTRKRMWLDLALGLYKHAWVASQVPCWHLRP